MRYAPFLQEGGTIGFVAPSFGCNIEPYRSAFTHAVSVFQEKGFRTVLGPNCYAGNGIGISNTPKACAEELMEFYTGANADVLISCGGGELMCEVLEHLDFDAICQAAPKWYMGYSDNTNLTFLLATIADTASIYGPCAAAFGMEPWHPAIADAYRVLCGGKQGGETQAVQVRGYASWEKESRKDEAHPLAPYHCTEKSVLRYYAPGKSAPVDIVNDPEARLDRKNLLGQVTGRLLGGCVDCLVNLLGTRFDAVKQFQERYAEDGVIWFLECCDLNVMAIRRAMWQMKQAGWFSHVKGFIIGRPLCHGEQMMGLDQYHAVIDIIEEYQVPVLMDFDIGHIPPMAPVICGSLGEIAVYTNGVSLSMQWK